MQSAINTMQKNKGGIAVALLLIALAVFVWFFILKPVNYTYDQTCLTESAKVVCWNVYASYQEGSLEVMVKDKDAKFICLNEGVQQIEYFTIKQMAECERSLK